MHPKFVDTHTDLVDSVPDNLSNASVVCQLVGAQQRETFPKFSRQFFDYFPKLVDTLPNFVDTFLKKIDNHPKLVDSVDARQKNDIRIVRILRNLTFLSTNFYTSSMTAGQWTT